MDLITSDTVRHLAELANLGITEGELDRYAADLTALAELASVLEDTKRCEEAFENAIPMSRLRADEVGECLSREVLLSAAPMRDEETFLVPRAVEE